MAGRSRRCGFFRAFGNGNRARTDKKIDSHSKMDLRTTAPKIHPITPANATPHSMAAATQMSHAIRISGFLKMGANSPITDSSAK
jgi:hypothetical protein